jgi:hypothetical protein
MKGLRIFGILALFLCLSIAAQAATYGYVVLRGKNAEQIEREVNTLERLIKTWNNGEVLYTHTVKTGLAFMFKRVTSTVFFAGDRKNISSILTSGPYEGDYLRDVVVRFNFTSMASKDNFEEINTSFTRKYNNVRNAIEEIKGLDTLGIWSRFEESRKRDYKKHLVDGEIIEPTASVVFYSVQPIEENRLFGISYGAKKIVNRNK